MHPLSLQKNGQSGFALTIPAAYRAWALWANELGFGCLQVSTVKQYESAGPQRLAQLCEVYSRAVFETAIGLHFDAVDSNVDMLVLLQIQELFSAQLADEVHAAVKARGPVIRQLEPGEEAALLPHQVSEERPRLSEADTEPAAASFAPVKH